MGSTAVAAETGGRPSKTQTERDHGRRWRSHWTVRLGLPALYLLGTAIAVDRVGLPYSQDWIFVWIVGLMLVLSVGAGEHSIRRLIKDWLPIIGALLAYDLLRGVADGKLFAIHWEAPIHADKIFGLGQVPTVRLQDALYTPGHLHLWDYAAGGLVAREAGATVEVWTSAAGNDVVVCAPTPGWPDLSALVRACGFLGDGPS